MTQVSPQPPAGTILTGTATAVARTEAKVSEEFETMFLGRFVDEMMKTVPDTVFGGTQQAEMWRSFLSDAVATQLMEAGSLSLEADITKAVAAYGAAKTGGGA